MAVSHFNNRLGVPLNIKEKWVGNVFRATVLWLCFRLPYRLFGNTRDTSVIHEKAKFVWFIYMQPQKMKFNYIQINMKRVSY